MTPYNLVVLTAGEASRLRPITTNCSKTMVRVNGKPALSYILDKCKDATEIVIVRGEHHDVYNYVKTLADSRIRVVQQDIPSGVIDAIQIGALALTNYEIPTVVWFGDTIILDDDMPFGEDFIAVSAVEDQHEWTVVSGGKYYHKPIETIPGALALTGVFGFKDTYKLIDTATAISGDVPELLSGYTTDEMPQHNTDRWYDIGVPSRYYSTCASLLNEKVRAFNRFNYDPFRNTLTKLGTTVSARTSIDCEALWYMELNEDQRLLAPRLVDHSNGSITISYEGGVQLSDLAAYENLTGSFWDYVINKLVDNVSARLHQSTADYRPWDADVAWVGNLRSRLDAVTDDMLSSVDKDRLITLASRMAEKYTPAGVMHGDLHLSNVLYDSQIGRFVLVDPRGQFGNTAGVLGDVNYDWSKLAYDCVHGFSSTVMNTKKNPKVEAAFINSMIEHHIDVDLVLDGGIVLMASGIPLHYDDINRQQRFASVVKDYLARRVKDGVLI